MEADKRRDRLRFRSWHRGTREIDLILGSFADRHLHAFTAEQVDLYEALLEEADPDLYDWMTGVKPVRESARNDVTDLLLRHIFKKTDFE